MKDNLIKDNRIQALVRFALAISILNIAGQFALGFEYSYAHTLVALATGYLTEGFMEMLTAKINNRLPVYSGGVKSLLVFLLPAHITSLAVSMLTFTNENLGYVVFGVVVAILSKIIIKVKVNNQLRHILNPSNAGISTLFLVFPAVGAAPPYQYSENTQGIYDWLLVAVFITLGSLLNIKYTKRIPLILSWLTGFFLQALIRSIFTDVNFIASIGTMTGIAFLLYTFYMIEDPGTTPSSIKGQLLFGFSVAIIYGILTYAHIVYGLFFSLTITCSLRGLYLFIIEKMKYLSFQRYFVIIKKA